MNKVRVVLEDAQTKRQMVMSDRVDMDLHQAIWFWTEGNFGCDCNRSAYFLEDHTCNTGDNRYRIISFQFNGEEIEGEFNDY